MECKNIVIMIFIFILTSMLPIFANTDNAILIVTISPQEVNEQGAGWRIIELHPNTLWYASGHMLALSGGLYTIEFRSGITGWKTPARKSVNLIAGKTTTVSGVYERLKGSLQVNISPSEVVESGAQWRIAGKETWRDSGEIENSIPTGTYIIELKPIEGWKAPVNVSVEIQEDKLTTTQVTYTKKLGSLVVQIEPIEAVNQGARWRLFGETTYRQSGAKLENILAKEYTIEFAKIPNWVEPAPIKVLVEEKKTKTITVQYRKWSDVYHSEGGTTIEGEQEGEESEGEVKCSACGDGIKIKNIFFNVLTIAITLIVLSGINRNNRQVNN